MVAKCPKILLYYILAIAGQTAGPNGQKVEVTHGWPGSDLLAIAGPTAEPN